MTKEEHGQRLTAVIERKQAMPRVVAVLADVPLRTLKNWMQGKAMPTPEQYAALCAYLGDYASEPEP